LGALLLPVSLSKDDLGERVFGVILLCFATLVAVLLFVYLDPGSTMRAATKAAARRLYKEGANPNVATPTRLSITPDGITAVSEIAGGSIRWSGVTKIVTTEDHAFLLLGFANAIVVPKRAFRDESEFDKFVEEARRYQELASKPQA
jgi:hypothetical protein